jgi:hypothetical protein
MGSASAVEQSNSIAAAIRIRFILASGSGFWSANHRTRNCGDSHRSVRELWKAARMRTSPSRVAADVASGSARPSTPGSQRLNAVADAP